MTIKRYAITVAMIVLATATGTLLAGRTSAGETERERATMPSAQAGSAATPNDEKWEYRILSAPFFDVYVVSTRPDNPRPSRPMGLTLEQQINELAAQGFQVESFQISAPTSATALDNVSLPPAEHHANVMVLMKRLRK